MSKGNSEFGRGLVICLVKFSEHLERLFNSLERHPHSEQFQIYMHFNAASDHLYDIEVPKAWKKQYPELCQMVTTLKSKTIGCGHGGDTLTKDEAFDLHKLAREIAIEIDKILGLKPDMGDW